MICWTDGDIPGIPAVCPCDFTATTQRDPTESVQQEEKGSCASAAGSMNLSAVFRRGHGQGSMGGDQGEGDSATVAVQGLRDGGGESITADKQTESQNKQLVLMCVRHNAGGNPRKGGMHGGERHESVAIKGKVCARSLLHNALPQLKLPAGSPCSQ